MFKKKQKKGVPIKRPSNENGRISIEVESGEFIIKKDSENPKSAAILKYKNKNGKIPTDEYDILQTVNAKDSSKK